MNSLAKMSTHEVLQESISTISSLRRQLDEATTAPLAIVGMGCRFPGGCDDLDSYWDLIEGGRTGVRPLPDGRWDEAEYYDPRPGTPGKSYVRESNFLAGDVSLFDAGFFRIAPVEANAMDPQQRLLLEVTWEALENAGQNVDALRGSLTGVFVGISSNSEYNKLLASDSRINQYTGTGIATSIASGRVAHYFGWNGPALSVDTACSSSLVTILLAAESLRRRECDLAVAGGVNLMLAPQIMAGLCMMNALAADGRSRPFDAAASGYGRGEGCGMIVLKRLADAERDGDAVAAVILGGAINNDGASSGLTVPNGNAQRAVLARAMANARVLADEVGFVETHGTGTLLGDPIEIDALRAVYGEHRSRPLALGAVKGNIGHLESAAGVAAVIKAVLCLQRGVIPPIAGLGTLNDRVAAVADGLTFPDAAVPWRPLSGRRRIAGVSSFGFSGTNGHLLLSDYAAVPVPAGRATLPRSLVTVTAATEAALAQELDRLADALSSSGAEPEDVAYTLNATRIPLQHRATIVAAGMDDLREGIARLLARRSETGSLYGDAPELLGSSQADTWHYSGRRRLFTEVARSVYSGAVDEQIAPKLACLFGPADPVAAAVMDRLFPAFATGFDEAAAAFPFPAALRSRLAEHRPSPELDFACGHGWATLLASYGLAPELACGIGAGAALAAVWAGALTVADGARVVSGVPPIEVDVRRPRIRLLSAATGAILRSADEVRSALGEGTEGPIGWTSVGAHIADQGYRFVALCGLDEPRLGAGSGVAAAGCVALDPVGADPLAAWLTVLAKLTCVGARLDWTAHYSGQGRAKTALPTYPFQRERFWLSPAPAAPRAGLLDAPPEADGLIPRFLGLPGRSRHALFTLTTGNLPDLGDNHGLVHIGHYLEFIRAAVAAGRGQQAVSIADLRLVSPVIVVPGETKRLLVTLDADSEGGWLVDVSTAGGDGRWMSVGQGRARAGVPDEPRQDAPSAAEVRGLPVDGAAFYDTLATGAGLEFGPGLRLVASATPLGEAGVEVSFDLAPGATPAAGWGDVRLPDVAAQAINWLVARDPAIAGRYLVNRLGDVRVRDAAASGNMVATVQLTATGPDGVTGRIVLTDEKGVVVLRIGEVALARFDEEALAQLTALTSQPGGEGRDEAFLERYGVTPAGDRHELLTQYLRALLAEVLEMALDKVSVDEPIRNFGLDSMTGLIFYRRTLDQLGIDVAFADFLQATTLTDQGSLLAELLVGGSGAVPHWQPRAADTDLSIGHWIRRASAARPPAVRLFCFPNGYRSADMFDGWREALGPTIEVCGVKLPGMDADRVDEEVPASVDAFVDQLVDVLDDAGTLSVPVATYGHSWGALFSYRLAHRLATKPGVHLVRMFASGYTSPSLQNSAVARLTGALSQHGFSRVPSYAEIRDDPEALDVVVNAFSHTWERAEEHTRLTLPQLLAACCLIDRFEFQPGLGLDVPVSVFHGVDDYSVGIDEISAWEGLTTGPFRMYTLAGDHQFIYPNQSEGRLLEIIRSDLGQDGGPA